MLQVEEEPPYHEVKTIVEPDSEVLIVNSSLGRESPAGSARDSQGSQEEEGDIPEEVLAFNEIARLGEGSMAGEGSSLEGEEGVVDPEIGEVLIDSHSRVRQRPRSSSQLVSSLKHVFEGPGGQAGATRGNHSPPMNRKAKSFHLDERRLGSDQGHVPTDDMGDPLYSSLDRVKKPNKGGKVVTFRESGDGREDAVSIISDPPDIPDKRPDL